MKKVIPVCFIFCVNICFAQTPDIPKVDTTTMKFKYDVADDIVYDRTAIATQPKYPGGEEALMKFLSTNLKYPFAAKELGVQGKAYVTFIIEKNGEVSTVQMLKGVKAIVPDSLNGKKVTEKDKPYFEKAANELNDEAIRVVEKMPAWTPGYQDGKAVRCKFILPITYKLQ